MKFQKISQHVSFPKLEEDLLKIWDDEDLFQKTLKKNDKKNAFVFYDGPPFATGEPHYGHLLQATIKDVIPRYKTMQGYYVQRRFGWDCHGLPIEYEVEKDFKKSMNKENFGIKDIEKMGIDKFNEICRTKAKTYIDLWYDSVKRMGRFIDMHNDYKTMDTDYMESIWWGLKNIYDKGLIYKGEKITAYCYRCGTPLSNFEANQEYKDTQDHTITVKFEVENEKNTYFLAWTTTPWTLISNLALAVNKDIDYVKVKDINGETYILAKQRLEHYYKNKDEYKIIDEFKGEKLENIKYKPMFNYFSHRKDAFFVLLADFVTTEDGTGIVHIAPAFGEDDNAICKKYNIKLENPVDDEGCFSDLIKEYKGENIHIANKKIIENLKQANLIVKHDILNHSYPHCWRCKTPLIYRALPTWFIEVSKIKDQLLANNENINWIPESIKYGRFGKWLENARDWAISRNRFWGSCIPIWECKSCKNQKVLEGLDDLYNNIKDNTRITKIILLRHGESEKNILNISSILKDKYPLTEKGIKQIEDTSKELKTFINDNVVLYTSPVLRAKQTADIIAKQLNLKIEKEDERLLEINKGKFTDSGIDLLKSKEYQEFKSQRKECNYDKTYKTPYPGQDGESRQDVENRLKDFFDEILPKNQGKTIIITAHGAPLHCARKILKNWSIGKTMNYPIQHTGKFVTVYYDNTINKEIDMHRHFIDDMDIVCNKCGKDMKRIPEVLDCWFESGSMPYAQNHYPFENKEFFDKNFPAEYIAEGQDQTRGWFYTLNVISTILFNAQAFNNVNCTGIILAEDGKKMSKSLKNYPPVDYIINKYGADSMRFTLIDNPLVEGQDLAYSEKLAENILKTINIPLWNTYYFFTTYANIDNFVPDMDFDYTRVSNKLDKWILAEFELVKSNITKNLDDYRLPYACHEIPSFIEKLNNFYIRRSRKRFWKSENDSDKNEAYQTLWKILKEFTVLLAPFMPFISDNIYRNLSLKNESVHLANWPELNNKLLDKSLIEEINTVKNIINLGLSLRAKKEIKIKQPLSKLEIVAPEKYIDIINTNADIIKEELNIKNIEFVKNVSDIANVYAKPDAKKIGPRFGSETQFIIKNAKEGKFEIKGEKVKVFDTNKSWVLEKDEIEILYTGTHSEVASDKGFVIALDTNITPELKMEGHTRELIRYIQDLRKEANYNVDDRINIQIQGNKINEILGKYKDHIQKETLSTISNFTNPDIQKEIEIDENKIVIMLKK